MTYSHSPFQKVQSHVPATLYSFLWLTIITTTGLHLAFNIFSAPVWHDDAPYSSDLAWVWSYISNKQLEIWYRYDFRTISEHPYVFYDQWLFSLSEMGLTSPIKDRLIMLWIFMMASTFYIYYSILKSTPYRDKLIHIEGRQPIYSRAAKILSKNERLTTKIHKDTIALAPKAKLSAEAETQHFIAVASSGGGKTQKIKYWLGQILRRGERVLIHDTKGDFTAQLPVSNFIFLAPHDKRSHGWAIARDCIGPAAARELAAALIPETQDPVWSNGSRELLTGILIHLQINNGTKWGWRKITSIAYDSPKYLEDILSESYPQAAQYISLDDTGMPNRTSFSFLVGLWTAIGQTIAPLAEAWGYLPEKQCISITEWLQKGTLPIIMQRSAQFPELSAAWMQALIGQISNYACSSALSDSQTRRIWLVLDEFAQLKKVNGFQQILETGRSKGICSIIGVQDLEQIAAIYGEKELKSWLNIIRTKIIGRMNAGPSAQFISNEVIGSRRVGWYNESFSSANQSALDMTNMNQASPTRSTNFSTEVVPAVSASDLEKEYGLIEKHGVKHIRSLVLLHGNAYQLDWPITVWENRRAAVVPADWTGVE